ncbi:MAG: MipA/OmpV family protein [Pseudomonadota bacterium]
MHKTGLCSALALQALIPLSAHAQGAPNQDGFSAGVIATVGVSPYVGEDTRFGGFPLISYRKGPFSIGFQGISYEFARSEQLTFSVGVSPRFTGLEDPDGSALVGIDRDFTIDAFLGLDVALGQGVSIETTVRQELTGEHDGQEVELELGYATFVGGTGLSFSAGTKYQSSDLANYTWGVFANEVIAGRPAYDTGDVFIPFVSVGAARPISEKLTLIGNIRADFLPDAVSDSPIVDESTPVSLGVGLSYKF